MKKTLICFFFWLQGCFAVVFGQSLLGTFDFNQDTGCAPADTRIGIGPLQVYTSNGGIINPTPTIVDDGSIRAMFYKTTASFSSGNNINFAVAPKAGESIIISSIRFRIRFACTNKQGNAGIFVTKKGSSFENTSGVNMIWTTGNNNVNNNYIEYNVKTSYYNDIFRSFNVNDSIRFLIAHGTNTLGCYIDSLKIYGYISKIPIEVNAANVTKNLSGGAAGANICWLLDKDVSTPAGDIRVRGTSNADRFEEMKIGALRFPYGHLVENYLWHVPTTDNPFPKNTTLPLNPQIATTSQAPAAFSWAVNADKTFFNSMNFDEFIALCQSKNIEPLIVVNLQSSKYNGGPTQQTLINTAKEWVRYANVTKGYNVKYWQIGNEVDHDNLFTRDEYVAAFKSFATAMKSIDSNIKVGTGILSNTSWNKAVRDSCGSLCSFFSTHNYQFSSTVASGGLPAWSKDTTTYASNGEATQNMLNNNFPDSGIEIMITESNITGGEFPTIAGQEDRNVPNLYKALYFFEETMNLIALKDVTYNFTWNVHSPWDYQLNGAGGVIIDNLLSNDYNNVLLPQGKVVKLINSYLKDQLIAMVRVNDSLRSYASISNDNKEFSLFLLNKGGVEKKAIVSFSNLSLTNAMVQRVNFTGSGPYTQSPWLTSPWSIQLSQLQSLVLPPYSVSVINISSSSPMKQPEIKTDIKFAEGETSINVYYNGKNGLVYSFPPCENAFSQLEIIDIHGRILVSDVLEKDEGCYNVSVLKPGIYLAKITYNDDIKVIKFVCK